MAQAIVNSPSNPNEDSENLDPILDRNHQEIRTIFDRIRDDVRRVMYLSGAFRPWEPLTWPSLYKLLAVLLLASLYKLLSTQGLGLRTIPPPSAKFLFSTLVICLIKSQVLLNERYDNLKVFARGNVPFVKNANPFSGNLFELIVPDNNIELLEKQHEKLGKTFGMFYGPAPWVFTIDLELIRKIFITDGARQINATSMRLPFVAEVNESLSQIQGNRWRRTRRMLNPTFTHRQMKTDNVYGEISNVCDLVLDCIYRYPVEEVKIDSIHPERRYRSRQVDVHWIFTKFTMEIVFRIAFGKNYCSVIEPDGEDDLVRSIREGGRLVKGPLVWTSIMFEGTQKFIGHLSQFTELGRAIDHIHAVLDESLESRRELHRKLKMRPETDSVAIQNGITNGASIVEPDADTIHEARKMIDTIIESCESQKMSEISLRANLFFIFVAGFETTAHTLTVLFWLLARHEGHQDKLREELVIEGEQSQYLDKCIKETLRLYPAVPSGVGRVLKEPLEHNGYTFFPGTSINPNIFALHRSRDIWGDDVMEFKPERWDEPNNINPVQYFAFAHGPRNCIGMNLAKAEIRAVTSRILLKYRVKAIPGKTVEQIETKTPNLIHWIYEEPIVLEFVELTPV